MVNKLKTRGIISSLLTLLTVIILISGIHLIFIKKNVLVNFFTFTSWDKVHIISGLIVSIFVIVHFTLNYKILKSELSKIIKK